MKKGPGMTAKILIGLLLGAAVGIFLHDLVPSGYVRDTVLINGVFYVIGNGFLRLMQMLVVPLVFCSLVCGSSAIGDTKKLGRAGVRTLVFYLATTALAISAALLIGSLVNPGRGLDVSAFKVTEVQVGESKSFAEVLLDMIPVNPFEALTGGNMLQVILFALLVGIILAKVGSRAGTVSGLFQQFNDIMMEMTMLVMKAAPAGVFCLIAKTFSGIGFHAFLPLLKYMAGVLLALAVQCFVIYMVMLRVFAGLNPVRFLKKFSAVMGFAFSTASSNAAIPMSIEILAEKMGVSEKISAFTVPLGATINMDGTAIMQGVAVVFAAQAFEIELGVSGYLTVIAAATLASVGTAGVPGVGLVTLSMVFQSVGLPIEAIGIIMGIDRILDMARTAVNVTGDAVCTAIVAGQEGELDRDIFNRQ